MKSIPHITLVEFDPVAFEEFPILLLKRLAPVVLLLAGDVLDHVGNIGLADGEIPVTALPMELGVTRAFGLEPFRGSYFDLLNNLRRAVVLRV